jgi:DNA-binding NtrC family response regulator/tetratricopeptide (TPR) repeat protein
MDSSSLQRMSMRFSQAANKFQFVLELPGFYQSADAYDRHVETIQSLIQVQQSRSDRIKLRLGLIYMIRTRSNRSALELVAEVKSLHNATRNDLELERLRRFVEAAVLLVKKRDYAVAIENLEQIENAIRYSEDHFLYALVKKTLGDAYMIVGRHLSSDMAYQDAIATFRRYGHEIFLAYGYNNVSVLKKKLCQYRDAEKFSRKAHDIFRTLGISGGQVLTTINMAILCLKTGNWRMAGYLFRKAEKQNEPLTKRGHENSDSDDSDYSIACEINYEHLLLLKREFRTAESRLNALLRKHNNHSTAKRMIALAHEFLGELHYEQRNFAQAESHLRKAKKIADHILPQSDLMTEIERRMAQVQIQRGNTLHLVPQLLKNIRLCRDIGDKLELSASLRVLGQVYAMHGKIRKSLSCFEYSIKTLKSVNECYELMRTCLAYGKLLVERGEPGAEIHLLEAQKLSKELELMYFLGLANIEYARLEIKNGKIEAAQKLLSETWKISRRVNDSDGNLLRSLLENTEREVERCVLKKSTTGAEELRKICRVYEETRFPIENIKPDMAYQVAQAIDAESLFLIRRRGKGYTVPLVYNVPVNEAKEMVRRLDRDLQRPLLGIEKDPKIFQLYTGHLMVCAPTDGDDGLVMCTCLRRGNYISPRQFEFLLASADAIKRLVDRGVESPPEVENDFVFVKGRSASTHPRGSFGDILTVSPDMINIIRMAERASVSQEAILIEGETGVGKELFANAIHQNSGRRGGSFVAINAGGLPINLLESQLFGHVKGAFTDAVTDRMGLIEDANGGTVFLDEVGDMAPELQVKLLRLLENGEYRRLGENEVRLANVRIVSATNRKLLKEVDKGTFRRDLYYRLGTVKICIPPLRFRKRDIRLLVRYFLRQCAIRCGQPHRFFEIDAKAMEALELYDWPGNVRELQNEIRRIVSLIGDTDVIGFAMLSRPIKEYLTSKNRSESLLERRVERYERRLILDALNKNDWNRLRTAEELGLPRTTLLAKMRRLNVAAR